MSMNETKLDLLKDLKIDENAKILSLDAMVEGETRYVRDLRINVKNALVSDNMSAKEAYLIALSVAVNERNEKLINTFTEYAKENEASQEEIAEIHACTSMLSVNNVFYRFRHFADKESYSNMPARIKMNVMMKPVLGKEFFELVSLVISAVNGCEQCVKSHEQSVMQLGTSEARVFDAIRLGAIVRGLSQVLN